MGMLCALPLLATVGIPAMLKAMAAQLEVLRVPVKPGPVKPVLQIGKGLSDRAWDTKKSFPSPFY